MRSLRLQTWGGCGEERASREEIRHSRQHEGTGPPTKHLNATREAARPGGVHTSMVMLEVPDLISPLEQEFLSPFPASVGLLGPPQAAATTPTEFLGRRAPVWSRGLEG